MPECENRQGGADSVLTPAMVEAGKQAFDKWWGEWVDRVDLNGAYPDPSGLFTALWASWKKPS